MELKHYFQEKFLPAVKAMFKSTQTQGLGSKAALGHQLFWISMSWNEAEWIIIPSDTNCQGSEKYRCFTPQEMCLKVGPLVPVWKQQNHVSACCAFSPHCGCSVQWSDKSVGQSTAVAAVLPAMLVMWLHRCFNLDRCRCRKGITSNLASDKSQLY